MSHVLNVNNLLLSSKRHPQVWAALSPLFGVLLSNISAGHDAHSHGCLNLQLQKSFPLSEHHLHSFPPFFGPSFSFLLFILSFETFDGNLSFLFSSVSPGVFRMARRHLSWWESRPAEICPEKPESETGGRSDGAAPNRSSASGCGGGSLDQVQCVSEAWQSNRTHRERLSSYKFLRSAQAWTEMFSHAWFGRFNLG